MAVLPGKNSDPGSHRQATAVPLIPLAAVAGDPCVRVHQVQLESEIWKVASGCDYFTCQSSQRESVAHSEIKIRVSVQFRLWFLVPSSTKEPPSDKEGGLNTTRATYHRKRGSVSLQAPSQPWHDSRALYTACLIYLTCTFPTATCSGRATLPSSLGQNFLSSYHSATSCTAEDCPA